MSEETTNPSPSPKPAKVKERAIVEIKLKAKYTRPDEFVSFGALVVERNGKRQVKVNGQGAVRTETLAKMPVYYAAKHNAYHILDATAEEVERLKLLRQNEILAAYRGA